jgi:hypothetical protein
MRTVIALLLPIALVLALPSCAPDPDPWESHYEEISSQRDEAVEDKDTWLGIAAFSAGIAGMLLFVGAGLGASARNKAGKPDE